MDNVENTKIFFDIGANKGDWANANRNSCKTIISVEASPFTFHKLLEATKNTNITPINYAICANDGKDITFFHCTSADTLSTLNKSWLTDESSRFCNSSYQEITCKTMTIDTMIQLYGIPELVKIDVEGGEYECVKSLTQKVNTLCFEWASEMNDVTYKCVDYLQILGFTKFYKQDGDNYTFRPTDYGDAESIKKQLANTVPKQDWGMIWCQ